MTAAFKSCVAAVVALLATAGPGLYANAEQQPQAAETPLPVKTAAIKREQRTERVTAFGTVAADPNSQFVVVSPINGIVRKLDAYSGQVVQARGVVAVIEPSPVARAQFAQLEIAVTNAQQQLEHIKRLYVQQLATKDQVASAEKALADASAQLEAQKKLGAGESEVVLKASETGVVTKLMVQIGAEVAANAVVAEFADRTSLMVQLGIEPSDAAEISPGDKVELEHLFVKRPAVPAVIASVGALVDPSTRLLNALVKVAGEAAQQFALGETVRATVATKQMEVLTIPRSAVLYDGNQPYVFLIKGGTAYRQNVQLSQTNGATVWVEHGLAEGDRVAISNVIELSDGTSVSERSP